MADPIYTAAHRQACCAAITALGNRIGLYYGATRVGTVYTDTTWGSPATVTEGSYDYAKSTGSTVTILVPAGTVPNGTTITHYGVHNGTTLLRRKDMPLSIVVNDGSKDFEVNVTPIFYYRGGES